MAVQENFWKKQGRIDKATRAIILMASVFA